jgi:CubicO group peptidase (beta-lactamase class C family)
MYRDIRIRLFIAAFCLAVSLPSAAAVQAAPTIGQQREQVLFWPQARREAQFRKKDKLFPSDLAPRGAHVHELPPGKPLSLGSMSLANYMEQHHLAGVMVLQHGRVRLERYGLGFGPHQRWESFSVAKSVTSTLLGIALQRGDIHSLHDTLDTYIPELRDSAYADVTVQQLLTMTSGVRWNEDYADAN